MREHEVPTHVQAEDKVLLWLTFPQIVAVVAVCAVSYGAYRYFPLGPGGVPPGRCGPAGHPGHRRRGGQGGRPGAAAGGRRPAQVQAGCQAYAGPVSELARPEAPAPVEAKPDPLRLLVNAGSGLARPKGGAEPNPCKGGTYELPNSRRVSTNPATAG